MTTRLAIVGYGKIANDQHRPAVAQSGNFELVATVDPRLATDKDAHPASFDSLDSLIDSGVAVDAVTLAVPPQYRHTLAVQSIAAGWHVMLEKPPGMTLSEMIDLERRAAEHSVTLYASWHSRHAPAVEPAREWLVDKQIRRVVIDWREDVRVWHPGQAWIWQPGGLGVFDPGINALSIATTMLPVAFFLREAKLDVPENCETPIAAELTFATAEGAPFTAIMDFDYQGEPARSITVDTERGQLLLSDSGAAISIDGKQHVSGQKAEYDGVYSRFAELIENAESDMDMAPFRHVADAFMLGSQRTVAAFHE